MRRLRILPLVVVALAAVVAARCSSGSGGDTNPRPLGRCETDLAAYLGTGPGATAKVAAKEDLLAGEAATGRAGDVLLKNDRIQLIIEQADRVIGPQPYGGNIIDADVVRPGEPARDRFGELGSLFQFGRTVAVDTVEILRDGSQGGAAVVAATGHDSALDFIHLPGLVAQYLPGLTVPDPDQDLHLRITKYYVLPPGSNTVKVIDAYCNDGKEAEAFAAGDLVDSGGQVESYTGRSGYSAAGDLSPAGLSSGLTSTVGEPFMAWLGADVAYGLIPATDANAVLVIAGVTASVEGNPSLLDWMSPNGPPPNGAMIVNPGATGLLVRDFVVGRQPGDIYEAWYRLRGVRIDQAGVKVTRAGAPVAGARVVAFKDGKVASLMTTDGNGTVLHSLPDDMFDYVADDGVTRSALVHGGLIGDAGAAMVNLELPPIATITVHVRDARGLPMPGKATVLCHGACATARADATAGLFRDVKSDGLPTVGGHEVFAYRYLDPSGDATIPVAAGDYTVYLSRGPEYALASQDVELGADGAATVEARLAHVVDTTGWMSGDLHVHAVNSPDSPVGNVERLESFMAEGVDVIVSTDHDFVTDFAPFMAQIPGSTRFMKAITGVELTTFDYGHYNAFPLTADPAQRNGGAVDWAGGRGPGLAPADIFQALDGFPGEQVIQINHARGGTFSALELDTRTFWTRAKPATYRIHAVDPDPATGDTRLFDPRFTAMEVQNGFGQNFLPLMNDWMSLLSRGLVRTATAVSDTHKRHGNAGYPRTYVRVGVDDPQELDAEAFAHAVNLHEAVGTNGPFVLLTAKADGGATAQVGDTLVSNGKPVTVEVEVRSPEWLAVDKVQLFVNAEGTTTNDDLAAPRALPAAAATLELVTTLVDVGDAKMRRATASWTFTPGRDAWLVGVVSGTKDMFPVVGKGGVAPLAFTNAILVDVDGQGWTPPVDLAAERARVGHVPVKAQPLVAAPTEADVRRAFARECSDE